MPKYLIKEGADCILAVDSSGVKHQVVDFELTLKFDALAPSLDPKRRVHIQKLLKAICSIPKMDLPKEIEIND